MGPRLGARIIDGLVLGAVGGIVNAGVAAVVFTSGGNPTLMETITGTAAGVWGSLLGLLSTALAFAYFALFDSRIGGTPGKKILVLEVRGSGGGNPTVQESLKRNAWLALGLLPGSGGLLQFAAAIGIVVTISNSDDNLGWHDTFAGTVVTRS